MYKHLSRRACWFVLLFAVVSALSAQIPTGYYSPAKGKKAAALKTSLFGIISNHVERSYDQLWQDFKTTDVREDGKIWDMYSSSTNYEPGGSKQGVNYKGEGDSYNREHSFPKSWFSNAKPMYTDLFHLYPTDGYVNGRRSNYPFGETDGDKYQSNGGFSKLGNSTLPGYEGIVFEPNDEYKGDFARTYFYMATAYEDKIANWDSPMLSHDSYTAYAAWALEMLLRWAQEDPVSPKELARNNAVYSIQNNRNPYIDFPGLEQYVWGAKTTTAFDPDNYDASTTPDEGKGDTIQTVCPPTFSPAGGIVAAGTKVTITAPTEGSYLYYTVNDGELQATYASATVTIDEATTIKAYAQFGDAISDTVTATYRLQNDTPFGENTYVLATDASQLKDGSQVLIVANTKNGYVAMASQGTDIRSYETVSVDSTTSTITTEVNADSLPYAFVLNKQGNDAWSIYDPVNACYVALNASANKLHTLDAADTDNALWTISIDASSAASLITNKAYTTRSIKYNSSAPRFATYTSGQTSVSLYVKNDHLTAIGRVNCNPIGGTFVIYSVTGAKVATVVGYFEANETIGHLPSGVYIVNGRKVVVK